MLGNKQCDWFILPILLTTPTYRAFSRDTESTMLVSQTFLVGILFSLDRQQSSREIMEMFWFFQIRFYRHYDSSCDSFFYYYFHSVIGADSIASENQTEVSCPIIWSC